MGLNDLLKQYKRIAIDTNVFIAVFAQEPPGEKALPLIDAAANRGTHEMIAPTTVVCLACEKFP